MNLSISDIEKHCCLTLGEPAILIKESGILCGFNGLPIFELRTRSLYEVNDEKKTSFRFYPLIKVPEGFERSYVRVDLEKDDECSLDVFAMYDLEFEIKLPPDAIIKIEKRRLGYPDAKAVMSIDNMRGGSVLAVFSGRCEIKRNKVKLFTGRSVVKIIPLSFAMTRITYDHEGSVCDPTSAKRLFLSGIEGGEADAFDENALLTLLMARDVLYGRFVKERLSHSPDPRRLLLENRYMSALGVKGEHEHAYRVRDALLCGSELSEDEKTELYYLNLHALSLSDKKAIIKILEGTDI